VANIITFPLSSTPLMKKSSILSNLHQSEKKLAMIL